jgi:hypothetical protein
MWNLLWPLSSLVGISKLFLDFVWSTFWIFVWVNEFVKRVRCLGFSMLASGTQVRGFKPSWSCRIFQSAKILSMPSFGGEVKPLVPCRRFVACERTLQIAWNSLFDGKINWTFLAQISPLYPSWWYMRELPKPGSYNKPLWLQYFWGH